MYKQDFLDIVRKVCSSEDEYKKNYPLLLAKANEYGIFENDLKKIIENEKKSIANSYNSNLSGFSSTLSNTTNSTASGFVVTSENEKFSEITNINTQGAMSIIQSARLKDLGNRKIMIKRIKPEFKDNNKYKELFIKEYENIAKINDPNIVHVLGKGKDNDGYFYYMEWIDGRTLSKMISNKELNNIELIKNISLQILSALNHLHSKQIFHRDLKPDNIMITHKGNNVKIIDLGLAISDDFDDNLLKAGTPGYLAPEQLNNAFKADAKSDIYSFGIILLEMITNQIKDKNSGKIKGNKISDIIHKSTQINPKLRFDNCMEIVKILEKKDTENIIPQDIYNKIIEFAKDGIITKAESNMLKLISKNSGIDYKDIKTITDLELEKAKEKIGIKTDKSSKFNISNIIILISVLFAVSIIILAYIFIFSKKNNHNSNDIIYSSTEFKKRYIGKITTSPGSKQIIILSINKLDENYNFLYDISVNTEVILKEKVGRIDTINNTIIFIPMPQDSEKEKEIIEKLSKGNISININKKIILKSKTNFWKLTQIN